MKAKKAADVLEEILWGEECNDAWVANDEQEREHDRKKKALEFAVDYIRTSEKKKKKIKKLCNKIWDAINDDWSEMESLDKSEQAILDLKSEVDN